MYSTRTSFSRSFGNGTSTTAYSFGAEYLYDMSKEVSEAVPTRSRRKQDIGGVGDGLSGEYSNTLASIVYVERNF